MTVMLSSLRVVSELDASGFTRGAAQQKQAQDALVASNAAWAASLANADAAQQKLPAGMARLSRSWIEGYSQASKFESTLRSIENAMGRGMSAERAAEIYLRAANGLGMMADSAQMAAQGLVSLAPIIDQVNQKIEANIAASNAATEAANEMARAQADTAAQDRVTAELARREAAANAAAEAEDRLVQQYSPAIAAARRYETELIRVNAALSTGKISQYDYTQAVSQAQAAYAAAGAKAATGGPIPQMIVGAQTSGGSAQASMAVFESQRKAAEADALAIERVNAEMERREKMAIAALTAEASAVAALQAKYDPLTAAMRTYQQEVDAIVVAERNGVISKQAMADAIGLQQQRLQSAGGPTGPVQVAPSILGGALAGASAVASARAFEDARASTEKMTQQAASLRAQLDPVGASFIRLNQQIADYDRLLEAGAINHTEYAQAVNLAQNGLIKTGVALNGVKQNARLTTFEITNLAYQFNDIAVMTASGQNPFVMMMQQGSQIGQVFTTKGATIIQAVRQIGTALVSYVTNPINIAILAIAVLALAAKKAFETMSVSSKQFEESIKSQKEILTQLKDVYGSIGDAITKISPESIPVIQLRAQVSIADVTKQIDTAIASMNRAGVPGSHEIGRFGTALPQSLNPVRDILNEFRRGEITLDQFRVRMSEVAMAADSIDTKKSVLNIITLTNTLAEAQRTAQAVINAINPAAQALARSMAIIEPLMGKAPPPASLQSFIPDLRGPREQLEATEKAILANAQSLGQVREAATRAAEGIAALDAEQKRSSDLFALDLEAIRAKSPEEKAEIARKREAIIVSGQKMDATQREIEANRAYTKSLAESTFAIEEQNKQQEKAARDSVRNAQLDVQLVGASNAQQELARANLATRIQLENEAIAQGRSANDIDRAKLKTLTDLNAARAREIDLLAQRKLAYDLEVQSRAAQMSPDEAAIFTKLKSAGIEENTAAWNQLAQAMRDANTQSMSFFTGLRQGFYDALHNINDFAASGKQILGDFFSGLEDQWVKFAQTGKFSFKDMINTMIGDISRLAYRMTMSGIMGMLGFGNTATANPIASFLGGAPAVTAGGILSSVVPSQQTGGQPGFLGWLSNLFGMGGSAAAPQASVAGGPAVAAPVIGGVPSPIFAPLASGGGYADRRALFPSGTIVGLPANQNYPMPSLSAGNVVGGGGVIGMIASAVPSLFAGGSREGVMTSPVTPVVKSIGVGGPGVQMEPMAPGHIAAPQGFLGLPPEIVAMGDQHGIGAATYGPIGPVTRAGGSGPFLDLVARAEGTAATGYNTSLGHGRFTGGEQNLSGMTLNQIHDLQVSMLAQTRALPPTDPYHGSSALGRYQITDRTMMGLREQMGLTGKELFDPAMQDRMALRLMMQRGNDVIGQRKEWLGLNQIPGPQITAAYQQQLAGIGGSFAQTNYGAQIAKAQETFAQQAGLMSGTVAKFNTDLSSSLQSITSGAQSAGSGFAGSLSGALQGILGKVGGTTGGILGGLIGPVLSIFGLAEGGEVNGYGTGRSDSNVVRLSRGEYVVNEKAATRHRPLLDAINYGGHSVGRPANANQISPDGSKKIVTVNQTNHFTAPGMREARRSQNQMAALMQASAARAARTA